MMTEDSAKPDENPNDGLVSRSDPVLGNKVAKRTRTKSRVSQLSMASPAWKEGLIPNDSLPEYELIARLAEIDCTAAEAAIFLRMGEGEFRAKLASDRRLLEAWNRARVIDKIAARRLLRWHAQQPTSAGVTATIALLKDINANAARASEEKTQVEAQGSADYSRLSTDELESLIRIRRKLYVAGPQPGGNGSGAATAPLAGGEPFVIAGQAEEELGAAPGDL